MLYYRSPRVMLQSLITAFMRACSTVRRVAADTFTGACAVHGSTLAGHSARREPAFVGGVSLYHAVVD